ncbi:MAG TPA: transglycosylase SLT domain-containing protein [Methylomirabilota bacterium]|nr:transglycosylase SLT domain-containing protein [Methylomirabilota bacterium]
MAVDPILMEPVGLIPVAWPVSQDAPADTFGQPIQVQETEVAPPVQAVVSLPLVTEPTPAIARPAPAPAYPVQFNEHVRFFLDRFQTGYRRAITEGRLARSGRYLPMIMDIFKEKGLPEELVFTAMIESGFNPVAVSRAGAKGLWQFMAPTARLYGLRVDRWLDERLDPEKSTVAAANYLRDLYTVFGSWDLAQAAYNAGEMRVQQAIQGSGTRDFWVLHRRSPYLLPETKNFVPAIHAATLIGRQPEQYGFTVVPEEPERYDVVTVPKGSRLMRLAGLSGVALADLEQLNPELWQKQTPPDAPYELKIPLGTAAAMQAAVELDTASRRVASRVPSTPRAGVYVVQAGDTVWRIARQHGVSAVQLARWNGLEHPDRIFPGERLRVTAS